MKKNLGNLGELLSRRQLNEEMKKIQGGNKVACSSGCTCCCQQKNDDGSWMRNWCSACFNPSWGVSRCDGSSTDCSVKCDIVPG
ncbi:MAG: hypothetical protein QM528_08605 [Phycisphaerales bacterium]|nr:hypothetical protein [Phycisphaerales bacterium]